MLDDSQECEYVHAMSSPQMCEEPRETATQRLASVLLGQDVREYIDERRKAGRPWRFVARDLFDATKGEIDVTHETLRQWSGDGRSAQSA